MTVDSIIEALSFLGISIFSFVLGWIFRMLFEDTFKRVQTLEKDYDKFIGSKND